MSEAVEHFWAECELCGPVVFCAKCGNNCCNGGAGTLSDGSQCDACPDAYAKQEAEYESVIRAINKGDR